MALGKTLSRRQALVLLGGATVALAACGGDDSPTQAPVFTDKAGEISANHGHAATITAAELRAGSGLELHIQGGSAHDHVVSLAAAEVEQVRAGLRVSKQSSVGGNHTHTVTFN